MGLFKRALVFFTASTLVFWIHFVNAGEITVPRSGLVLEYLFNNWTVDSSWNNNATKAENASYGTETNTGWTYAYFSWSTQIAGYTWWETDSLSAFTVSLWIKTLQSDRSNAANMSFGCPPGSWYTSLAYAPGTYYCDSYTRRNFVQEYYSDPTKSQLLFTTKRVGGASTNVGVFLNNDYKCQIESNNQLIDCSSLKDERWHNVIIRKNGYKTVEILLDGKQVASYPNDETTMGRTISLWKGTFYWNNNEGTKYKGKLARMRIYNAYLSDSEVSNLFFEFDNNPVSVVDPKVPVITVSNPSSETAAMKRISATTSTGVLTMSVTAGSICDGTLTFEDYNDLSFSSLSDNGKGICYRAVNGDKTTYKMSAKLTGITTLITNISTESIFDGSAYKSWPGSPRIKANDFTYPVLGAMTGVNFVDVNGDGLIDVLYSADYYRAILANTGDYNFRAAYKCKTLVNWSNNSWVPYYYHGDCADTNYR